MTRMFSTRRMQEVADAKAKQQSDPMRLLAHSMRNATEPGLIHKVSGESFDIERLLAHLKGSPRLLPRSTTILVNSQQFEFRLDDGTVSVFLKG